MLYDLAIELICANSSEAKGRVERANQTLQDRLIKEMRLEGITGIEAANAWLATFIADFNRRFSRPARFPKDLHRPVQESPGELRDIFAWHDVRTVSKSLTFQYDKILYLMDPTEENSRLAGEKLKYWTIPMAPSPSTMDTGALSARHLISWPVSTRGRLSITNVSGLYSDWLR
ncbi:Uncharacterised protein [Raoultella ornithinolytica]|nr:Uncharacterised protein [Raoultella ornithinolytica]